MSNRAVTACDQCGQYDDHPKVHYATETYHHDCTPFKVKQEVVNGHPDSELISQIFSSAEGGVRGAELLAKIEELHSAPQAAVEATTPEVTNG